MTRGVKSAHILHFIRSTNTDFNSFYFRTDTDFSFSLSKTLVKAEVLIQLSHSSKGNKSPGSEMYSSKKVKMIDD